LDAEPNYEDHPVNPWPKWNTDSGYYRDYDVRKQLYSPTPGIYNDWVLVIDNPDYRYITPGSESYYIKK
jgi:hypothetical protein